MTTASLSPHEKRRGYLMLSATHRQLTEAEREELVSILLADSPDSGSER